MRRTLWIAVFALGLAGCDSRSPAPADSGATPAAASSPMPLKQVATNVPASPHSATPEEAPVSRVDGVATWYDVPGGSLPERRAPGEFTAAYDRLPLGTYARVTAKSGGRSVVVCITDRGVGKRRTIDVCKEAAEELGLVGKGEMKVLIE